ncbi:hypothetical protein FRC12_016618 [Ceratobasidium sp. 428]|nr:hypothetical protein FRC12_016618 [Ceratobasidium sp. 428]
MSVYKLSDIRTRIAQQNPAPSIGLHTLLEDSPEPTTTASGTVPGKALFDKPSPAPADIEPETQGRYPQRVRIATAAIAQHNEEIAQEKARRKSRRPRKKRSSNSLASESETSQYASEPAAGSPRAGVARPFEIPQHIGTANGGEATEALHRLPPEHELVLSSSSTSRVPGFHGDLDEDPSFADGEGRSIAGSDEAGSEDRDREVQNWDFSVDPEVLANKLARLCGSNPSNFSDYSPRNLRALIEECYKDQTPQVQPPKHRKAEAKPATNQARLLVGGGHHLHPNWSESSSRNPKILQKQLFAEDYNTDTEPETEDQYIAPTTTTHDQPDNTTYRPSNSPSPLPRGFSGSPSPLPRSQVPVNPRALPLLELPVHYARETPGPTQGSTQPKPISNPRASITVPALTRQATSTTERVEQAPSQSGSQKSRHWVSTSLISLGQPVPPQAPTSRVSSQRSNAGALAPPAPTTRPASSHPPAAGSSRSSRAGDRDRPSLGILRPRSSGSRTLSALDAQARAKASGAALREQHTLRAASGPAPAPAPAPALRFPPGPAMNQAWSTARSRFRARLELDRRRREQEELAAAASTSNPTANNRASQHSGPSRVPSPPDLVSDDEEQVVAAAARANGQHPKGGRKKKPAARNVHGNERHMLTAVKHALYAFAVREGAWPTRGLLKAWIAELWSEIWETEFPGMPVELPSPETVQVIINGLPTFRCKIKDLIRSFTAHKVGFIKPATTPDAIKHNIELFKTIHPNKFHCLEYNPVYGHYESPLLTEAIAETCFPNPTGIANSFRQWYEPMPLTAVAFVLANLQFCIEEYETGQHQARDLNAADMLNKYVAHLRGLKEAALAAKGRMARLQQEWFDYGFAYSGAMEVDDPYTQVITHRSEVRPDTPSDHVSEAEAEE